MLAIAMQQTKTVHLYGFVRMISVPTEKGEPMTNNECAKWLIELHSDYFDLAGECGQQVVIEYAEAVAMAIMALAERRTDDI